MEQSYVDGLDAFQNSFAVLIWSFGLARSVIPITFFLFNAAAFNDVLDNTVQLCCNNLWVALPCSNLIISPNIQ